MSKFGCHCWRALIAVALVLALVMPARADRAVDLDRVLDSVKEDLGLVDASLIRIEIGDERDTDGNTRVGVVLDGVDVTLEMWSHSVRSDRFRVREQLAKGAWRTVEPGPVRTVRGRMIDIDGGGVAGSFDENGLIALVEAPDFGEFWIEPVAQNLRGGDNTLHVVYRETDVIGDGGICGVVDDHAPQPGGEHDHGHTSRGSNCGSQVCVTQIACDTDVEFINTLGGSANAQARIEDLMNLVSWQYEAQVGITYEITDILLRTSEPDPYNTTDASALLSQFRSHWNSNHGSIPRDVAHLFTGKEIDSSTIGIAYVGVICTGSAYGLSQTPYSGSFSCKSSLVAHELGHNWSAPHCDCPANTMNPSNTCYRIFTSGTQNIITNHRDSRGCLHGGVLPPPDPFSLLIPTDGRGNVGSSPTLQWQESVRATGYHLLVDDDADFSSPEVDQMTPDRIVSISGLHPARLYYWKVTASGIGGSTLVDETFCFFTGSLLGRTLYVDADAPAGGSGLNWGSALDSLDSAQEIGRCVGPARVFEVRVAEGVYTPADASGFELATGIALLGGYPGYNTGSPDVRDPAANVTVLSGGAGVVLGGSAHHVVVSTDDDSGTLIDGFTIENGDAQDGLGGGGILMNNSSAVVSNCIIRDCTSADPGGAVRVGGGSPSIVNCLIQGCDAPNGGAVYTDAPMTMTNCTVIDNSSVSGGALALDAGGSGSVTVVNTAFHANSSSSIDAPGSLAASVSYSYVPEGYGGTGNTALPALPNFEDELGGDFTPGEDSALIDRGDSGAASGVGLDLAGNTRDIDATNYVDGTGGTVDIGAYEAPADTAGGGVCDGDANGDNVIDVNDISYVLFRLGGAPPDGDANGDGTIDVNDISYVLFRLGNPC